jgi:predicted DNA-binding transcriptional regulator AlpA
MTAASEHRWQAPERDWLPLLRAPFYFFPEYAGPGAPFREAIARLLGKIGYDGSRIVDGDGDCIGLEAANVRLVINAEVGEFAFEPADNEWGSLETAFDMAFAGVMDDPRGPPAECIMEARGLGAKPDYAKGVALLLPIAERLWAALELRFDQAVESGEAQIVGRWHTIDRDFTPIFADQWRQLDRDLGCPMDDDSPGLIRGDRYVIYSPHVRPIAPKIKPTALALRRCHEWLIEERRSKRPARPREEVMDEALGKFEGLTKKGFSRVYVEAQKAAPNKEWDMRGPKRKLNPPAAYLAPLNSRPNFSNRPLGSIRSQERQMLSNERFFSTDELSRFLRVSTSTLAKWRLSGSGPRFVKLGHRVAYRQADIDEYLSRQTRASTSEDAA